MISITSLWLPILVGAVLAFFASAVTHMLLPIHLKDFGGLPDEEALREALRKQNAAPGDYVFPHAATMKEMGTPEMKAKYEKGPNGLLTITPSETPKMGKPLLQWFIYLVVVCFAVAYLASRTLDAGAEYLQVFRVTGTVAFLATAGAEPVVSIWYRRSWSTTAKNLVDGLIYALLIAGSFAGFWPE